MEKLRSNIEAIKLDLENQITEVNASIEVYKANDDYDEALHYLNEKIILTNFLSEIKIALIK